MRYAVLYDQATDGTWGAVVPDLPGCCSAGETRPKAIHLSAGDHSRNHRRRLLGARYRRGLVGSISGGGALEASTEKRRSEESVSGFAAERRAENDTVAAS